MGKKEKKMRKSVLVFYKSAGKATKGRRRRRKKRRRRRKRRRLSWGRRMRWGRRMPIYTVRQHPPPPPPPPPFISIDQTLTFEDTVFMHSVSRNL